MAGDAARPTNPGAQSKRKLPLGRTAGAGREPDGEDKEGAGEEEKAEAGIRIKPSGLTTMENGLCVSLT